MALVSSNNKVLVEAYAPAEGTVRLIKQAALVVAGIALLAVMAKIKIPMWPVAISMGTFAVLTIGAAYGPRLGLVTIMGYMILGALGMDLFQNSSAEVNGLTYMMGGTGGYLVGYVLAVVLMGYAARAGWDRSVGKMALAMLAANAVMYIPGVLWLGQLYGFDQPILQWGLYPFLIGDALKLALAALLLPALWKLIGSART
ncbi:biotin transporter BioY [Flavimaricola marinus]|uniref:Biotin transporter n=1 Tax=Flavimaricola marinus TaxID=1819565 RepID=A0A238LHD4_9RHOB|nr:biotin transporter BioY [Flavimaricola marinus]SMY09061.1 Biotin transporter BioY [Flavimaricola marinus]